MFFPPLEELELELELLELDASSPSAPSSAAASPPAAAAAAPSPAAAAAPSPSAALAKPGTLAHNPLKNASSDLNPLLPSQDSSCFDPEAPRLPVFNSLAR